MEQEIKLTNENFMRMHEKIEKNKLQIANLQVGFKNIEEEQVRQDSEIKELMVSRELSEATLKFIIKESVNEAVEPLLDRINTLEKDVSNLETEKYKNAYETVKWISIAGGSVIIAFVVGELIKAIVN
ncbi:hypothetical protein MXG18_002292 [Listeria monocytogenes]|uniref:hypothetical protein n=1 Tax=Listeria monocytogenes TaxID=1639 RepID=UPI0008757C7D|nr:hypothetical protein [Listeria monocytogenes]EAD8851615.1 hypothetical protein [Listeria monocytogenes]ECC0876426.1 hypothetical protein [Listeria monocytogenes]ECK6822925.1 hypothetical protein [Listeria monocytogenes]EJB8834714.1 hypothetical protein [Listeria monocytogenes]OFF51015.1 hypothetical protein BJM32_07105 [Listeria monocytogenes]